jgi:hypothetical protein
MSSDAYDVPEALREKGRAILSKLNHYRLTFATEDGRNITEILWDNDEALKVFSTNFMDENAEEFSFNDLDQDNWDLCVEAFSVAQGAY